MEIAVRIHTHVTYDQPRSAAVRCATSSTGYSYYCTNTAVCALVPVSYLGVFVATSINTGFSRVPALLLVPVPILHPRET